MLIRRFDPRVHFALVCGAKSCPPISFYDGDRIEEQLDQAARTFIRSGGIRLDAERETIWLSKIFQWYRADFGGRNGVLEVVSKHLREDDAGSVSNLRHLRIRYLPYDWSVNAKA
jgi:hypothetical protein